VGALRIEKPLLLMSFYLSCDVETSGF